MSLQINITLVDDLDYDGNPTQFKSVVVDIDGKRLPLSYSYDPELEDSVIEAAAENDLANRGYVWE